MGYRVTAVEASAEVCRVLKAKAAAGVEGAVEAPCVVCQQASVPAEQRHPVEIMVLNQSICAPLQDNGFDLGLCVFTVLNYIVEEEGLRQFATVAANALRPEGKLLVSFVSDLAAMRNFFNRHPQAGKSPDGHCSAVRNINIQPLQETLYEYDEQSELTKDGQTAAYSNTFRLRSWSREQIVAAIEAAGFRMESDLTGKFSDSGEVYLLFSRNSSAEHSAEHRPAGAMASPREDAKAFLRSLKVQPDDSESILAETPENVLLLAGAVDRRRERTKVREAQDLLEHSHEHQVFFYPGSSSDWEPLCRFTHLCDTFIFCDWETEPGSVGEHFGVAGLTTEFVVTLDQGMVDYLSDNSRLHPRIWRIVKEVGGRPLKPWGKYARLARSVGNITRPIHFFFLGIEGVTTFFNLFTPMRTAPKIICLKGVGGFSGNWTGFHGWDQPLGQLVRRCDNRPTHLVAEGGPGTWPYPCLWQRFADWDRSPAAYVAEDYGPKPLQAKPLGGARRVVVKRGILTPEVVAGCPAVVLPISLYLQHQEQWPAQATIMLLVPPDQEGQLPANHKRVVLLGSKRAPLGELLGSLAQTCTNLGIDRVSSVGIGYEDEGPELDVWRRQSGPPLELTIYCEHGGDVESLGPFADEIQ